MRLPEISIRQPVLAVVLSLVLVVLGVVGLQSLEIRFFPKLEVPVVTINSYYQGASAKLMDSEVTTPIENALAGIDGVKSITSSSSAQYSNITVLFRLGGNFEQEASEVRDKTFGIKDKLPSDMTLPTVNVGAKGSRILGIGFTDKEKSNIEIRNYLSKTVTPLLRQVKGVGEVDVLGSTSYAMRIWLNASKMAALNITVTDIKTALLSNNIYFPAGSFQGPERSYGIVSKTELGSASAFSNIILRHDAKGTVRLKDVSRVDFGSASLSDAPMRINGKNGVELMIKPLQDANPITVATHVRQKLEQLKSTLPDGMHASVNYDVTTFLKSSIDETGWSMLEAVVLVILVIFLCLGSIRAAVIPIVTIPVSLIAVFGVIKLLGFSINIMTLLGIVLAIGLVVDDAIVMLENIHRYIEKGMKPFEASLKGSKEIGFAVVAMALTLAAVYAPIGFISGFTSELFKEFAFTLGSAVVISAFVALTLSPMMCSKILLPHSKESRYNIQLERTFDSLSNFYQKFLKTMLANRFKVIIVLLIFAAVGFVIFKTIPSQLIPKEDIGFIEVSVASPSGSSLDYTNKNVKQLEQMMQKMPSVSGVISQVYSSGAHINVTLKPWGERKKSTVQIVEALNAKFANVPLVTAVASQPDIVNYGLQGSDIQVNLMTTGNTNDLLGAVHRVMAMMKHYPGMSNINTNLKFNNQQYAITINRDLAAVLGVNIQDIADTVSAMMSGGHWTDVQSNNESYPVYVQMQKKDLQNFNALSKLYVRASTPSATAATTATSSAANMIPVSSLVTLKPIVGQGSLTHYDRFSSGSVTATVNPGFTESQAVQYVQKNIQPMLHSNVTYAFSGKAQQFVDSSSSIAGIIFLSIIFIYLVMAAQFGSFIDPFIVLLGVPLSIVGALIALRLGGGTLSIYSEIGFVTLIGMISKHGILITQFINSLRKDGVDLHEAIVKGATIRLRPILMTTAAMVFGALPLAIASGPGSIGRHQIGWVIVGGLLLGTFFSLVVVPIAYSFLGKYKKFSKPS